MKTRLFLVASLLILSVTAFASTKRKPAPVATGTVSPVVPQTLEQMPAKPPNVTFQGGLLTIAADNSTLGDILHAVKAQTGAEVDFPGNAADRVVGQFGPGPARDVLAQLLNGSHFNYVLLGSANNADALDRVILTAKSSALSDSGPAPEQADMTQQPVTGAAPAPFPGGIAALRARNMGVPAQQNTVTSEPEDPTDDTADDSDGDAQDDQTDDAADDQQADDTQQADGTAGAADQQNPNTQNGVKSPEQLLQELQQQGQQQQPQQPGLPGPPGMQGAIGQQGPHN